MSVCLPQRCLCCHFFKCLNLRVTWGPGKHNTHFNYCRALDWILGVCAILSSLVWKNAFPAVLGVLTLNYVIPLCLRGRQKEMCITVLFVVIRHVCDGCKWGTWWESLAGGMPPCFKLVLKCRFSMGIMLWQCHTTFHSEKSEALMASHVCIILVSLMSLNELFNW